LHSGDLYDAAEYCVVAGWPSVRLLVLFWVSGRVDSVAVDCAVFVAISVVVVDASSSAGRCCAPASCSRI